jgi:hypothetical protein
VDRTLREPTPRVLLTSTITLSKQAEKDFGAVRI